MPNPENVIGKGNRFKKGQSGNPKGRPKLPSMKTIMESVLGDIKDGKSAAEAIMMAMRNKAIRGDVRAAEFIIDRAYGKAKESIELSGSTNMVIMPKPPGEEEENED
jgi:hypothetical protein